MKGHVVKGLFATCGAVYGVNHYAYLAAHMDISFNLALGLINFKPADGYLFADYRRLRGDEVLYRAAFCGAGIEGFHVCGLVLGNYLCNGIDYAVELFALGNEVGLAVDFNKNAGIARYICANDALCGNPAFLLTALAMPRSLKSSAAFSISPSASCKAFLQSSIPAPLFSRRVITSFAVNAIKSKPL